MIHRARSLHLLLAAVLAAPGAVAAQEAHLDEQGRWSAPPAAKVPEERSLRQRVPREAPPESRRLRGGGEAVRVPREFRKQTRATIAADGALSVECERQPSEDEAR